MPDTKGGEREQRECKGCRGQAELGSCSCCHPDSGQGQSQSYSSCPSSTPPTALYANKKMKGFSPHVEDFVLDLSEHGM